MTTYVTINNTAFVSLGTPKIIEVVSGSALIHFGVAAPVVGTKAVHRITNDVTGNRSSIGGDGVTTAWAIADSSFAEIVHT